MTCPAQPMINRTLMPQSALICLMSAHGDPRYSYGRRGRQSVQECSRQLDNDCGSMSSVGKRRNHCDLRHSGFEVHLFA